LLYIERHYEDSITQLNKTLEIDPSFAATHYRLGLAYGARGLQHEAIRHFEEAQRLSDDSPQALGALGYLLGQTRDRVGAHEILRRLGDFSKVRYVSATIMAEVQTGLGQDDEELAWLERAGHERAGALVTFRVDPRFDRLRSKPACQQILQNLGPLT